jgi:uncharacterized delta-60 repeat protein
MKSLTSCLCGLALAAQAQSPLPDEINPGADSLINAVAVQPDGKIVLGGRFTTLGGQSLSYMGRLNADGTLDAGFNPGANNYVYCLALQDNGSIVVAGSFTTLGRQTRNRIARLNSDGSLDAGFNPGANSGVYALAVQADGKILLGGGFTTVGGQTRNHVARLNADGSLDAYFNPGTDGEVDALAVQPDGRVVIGGSFTTLAGQQCLNIARLSADGTFDAGFNPGADAYVASLAVQADGKILVGGNFTTLGGDTRYYIGRLNADGSLDAGFNPGAGNYVCSMGLQADSKILVGGWFTTLGGQTRQHLGRLNADGTLDRGFTVGANNWVYSLAVQSDGKVLVSGTFSTLGGQGRSCVGRLNSTESAAQTLAYDGSTITWLRGGTSPEVWRTVFEASPDGANWSGLGAGLRTTGGWQLQNITLQPGTTIRARGWIAGGHYNASAWYAETSIIVPGAPATPPAVTTLPANSITAAAATLNGTIGPSNATTDAWFDYGLTTSHGNSSVITNVGAGSSLISVALPIGGLSPNTIYHYRLVATNSVGTTLGGDLTLQTMPVTPPTVTTLPANSVTTIGATLSGAVNPNGATTGAWFDYGLTTSYGNSSVITKVGAGSSLISVTVPIGGLSPNTIYHYRLVATNSAGTTLGGNVILQTMPVTLPAVTTLLLIDTNNALPSPFPPALGNLGLSYQLFRDETSLNAALAVADPQTTLVVFDCTWKGYALTGVDSFVRAGGRAILQYYNLLYRDSLAAALNVSAQVTIYMPPPIYDWGGSPLFSGLSSPLNTTDRQATDGQTLQPAAGGQAVAGYVATSVPNQAAIVIGNSGRTICNGLMLEDITSSAVAIQLAQNEIAFVIMGIPPAPPPAVTTLPATGITTIGATLNGTVNPNGATTRAWFDFGLTTSYGNSSVTTNAGGVSSPISVALAIGALSPGTIYHYRLAATNPIGTDFGADLTFQTVSLPPQPTICDCARLGNGCFQLHFIGQTGVVYTVEASFNLTGWTAIGVATQTPSGLFEFTDLDAPNQRQCYYRLRTP